MSETHDLGKLIERVEAAEDGDFDLDEDLFIAFGKRAGLGGWGPHCHFTSSINAAIDLVEGVRPGWRWARSEDGVVSIGPDEDGWWTSGAGATVPLQILSALLRSLQSEDPSNG